MRPDQVLAKEDLLDVLLMLESLLSINQGGGWAVRAGRAGRRRHRSLSRASSFTVLIGSAQNDRVPTVLKRIKLLPPPSWPCLRRSVQ